MPPYIQATELSLVLPAGVSIGASTIPFTDGEIGSIIAEVSAELDGAAAQAGYSVPVSSTATTAFAQMQRWTKQGAGAQVLQTIFANIGGGSGGTTTQASVYWDAYQAALRMLRKGEVALVGAGTDSGVTARELPRSYSTSNPIATVGVQPTIDIDSVF